MEKTNLTLTQTVAHLLVFSLGVCVIVPIYWVIYIIVGALIFGMQAVSFVLQFFITTTDIILHGYRVTRHTIVEFNKKANVK